MDNFWHLYNKPDLYLTDTRYVMRAAYVGLDFDEQVFDIIYEHYLAQWDGKINDGPDTPTDRLHRVILAYLTECYKHKDRTLDLWVWDTIFDHFCDCYKRNPASSLTDKERRRGLMVIDYMDRLEKGLLGYYWGLNDEEDHFNRPYVDAADCYRRAAAFIDEEYPAERESYGKRKLDEAARV